MTPEEAMKVLGLTPPFTFVDIARAYRAASKIAHPDTPTGTHELMLEVNEADEVVRRVLAEELKAKTQGRTAGTPSQKTQAEPEVKPRKGPEVGSTVPLTSTWRQESEEQKLSCPLPPAAYFIPVSSHVINLINNTSKVGLEIPVVVALPNGKQQNFFAPYIWNENTDLSGFGTARRVEGSKQAVVDSVQFSDDLVVQAKNGIWEQGDKIVRIMGHEVKTVAEANKVLRTLLQLGLLWKYKNQLINFGATPNFNWFPSRGSQTVNREYESWSDFAEVWGGDASDNAKKSSKYMSGERFQKKETFDTRFPHRKIQLNDRDTERLGLHPGIPVYVVLLGSETGFGSLANSPGNEDIKHEYGVTQLVFEAAANGLANNRWGVEFVFPEDYVTGVVEKELNKESFLKVEQRFEANQFLNALELHLKYVTGISPTTNDEDVAIEFARVVQGDTSGLSYGWMKGLLAAYINRNFNTLWKNISGKENESNDRKKVALYRLMLRNCLLSATVEPVERDTYLNSSFFSKLNIGYAVQKYTSNVLLSIVGNMYGPATTGALTSLVDLWIASDPYFAEYRDFQLQVMQGSMQSIPFRALRKVLKDGYVPPEVVIAAQKLRYYYRSGEDKHNDLRRDELQRARLMQLLLRSPASNMMNLNVPQDLKDQYEYFTQEGSLNLNIVPPHLTIPFMYAHASVMFSAEIWAEPVEIKVQVASVTETFKVSSVAEFRDQLSAKIKLKQIPFSTVVLLSPEDSGSPLSVMWYSLKNVDMDVTAVEALKAGVVIDIVVSGKVGETSESVRIIDNARAVLSPITFAQKYGHKDDLAKEGGSRASEDEVDEVVGKKPYFSPPPDKANIKDSPGTATDKRSLLSPIQMVGYSFQPELMDNLPLHLPTYETGRVGQAYAADGWQSRFYETYANRKVDPETGEEVMADKSVPDLIFGLAVMNLSNKRSWAGDIKLPKGYAITTQHVLYVLYAFGPDGSFQIAPFNRQQTESFLQFVAGFTPKTINRGLGNDVPFLYDFDPIPHFSYAVQSKMTIPELREKPTLFSAMLYGFTNLNVLVQNEDIIRIEQKIEDKRKEKEAQQEDPQKEQKKASAKKRREQKMFSFTNPRVRRNAEGPSDQQSESAGNADKTSGRFEKHVFPVPTAEQAALRAEAVFKYLSYGFSQSRPPGGLSFFQQAAAIAQRGKPARAQRGVAGGLIPIAGTTTNIYSIPATYRRMSGGWMNSLVRWMRETNLVGFIPGSKQPEDTQKILDAMAYYGVDPESSKDAPYSRDALEALRASIISDMEDPSKLHMESFRPFERVVTDPSEEELDNLATENDIFAQFNPRRQRRDRRARHNPDTGPDNYKTWMQEKFFDRDYTQVPDPPEKPSLQAATSVYPEKGLSNEKAAMRSYGQRLADSGYLVQFSQRPAIEDTALQFDQNQAEAWKRQAGFSLDEARAFARKQGQSFINRKRTSIPVSSVVCAYARSPRLKAYRLPAALLNACGGDSGMAANQKVVIWMSPAGLNPQRIMMIRRNVHIDCDFVPQPPVKSRAKLLALALQDTLLWIAQKGRRSDVTRVYLGEIGNRTLLLAWKPGDPITFDTMIANLVQAKQRKSGYVCEMEDYDADQDMRNYSLAVKASSAEPFYAPREETFEAAETDEGVAEEEKESTTVVKVEAPSQESVVEPPKGEELTEKLQTEGTVSPEQPAAKVPTQTGKPVARMTEAELRSNIGALQKLTGLDARQTKRLRALQDRLTTLERQKESSEDETEETRENPWSFPGGHIRRR